MKQTPEIQQAFARGERAFLRGVPCFPARDPHLVKSLRPQPTHPANTDRMRAWIAGWAQGHQRAEERGRAR